MPQRKNSKIYKHSRPQTTCIFYYINLSYWYAK